MKGGFYQIFKELKAIFLNLSQKIEEERRLPNSFYGAKIILIPKPEKYTIKRYSLVFLMNKDAEIFNKKFQIKFNNILEKYMHKSN